MNVLEKILEEIEVIRDIMKSPIEMDCFEGGCKYSDCTVCVCENIMDIIRSHMDEQEVFEFDFNRVKSFDCQCGRHYVNTYDGGWISVDERLPEEGIYVMCCFDDGTVDTLWQNWKDDKSSLRYTDVVDNQIRKVIAWQPLPEPYKPNAREETASEHIMNRFIKVE